MTASRSSKPRPIRLVEGVLYDPVTNRARIEGSGLEPWEVYRDFVDLDRDLARARAHFDWLTAAQLDAALRFAELNPEFIAARLRLEDEVPQRLAEWWRLHPHLKPPYTA